MSQATIYVPKDKEKGLCFIIEDYQNRREWFVSKLGIPRIEAFFDVPEEAIAYLDMLSRRNKLNQIYAFFLDHDLGGAYKPPYSIDIAKFMYQLDPAIGYKTVIHSANEPGARNLQAILPGSVYFPFGFFDIENQP
jgi:hypothetical protein